MFTSTHSTLDGGERSVAELTVHIGQERLGALRSQSEPFRE